MLLHFSCCSYILHKWQGINLMVFIIHVFQDLYFILPLLIIMFSKFLLVILEVSPSFLQDIKIYLPLDVVNVVCSDTDMNILSNQIRSLTPNLQQQYVGCELRFQFYLASLCFWV
jgi:hypothetical protein